MRGKNDLLNERLVHRALVALALAYVGFHLAYLFVSFGPVGGKVIHVSLGIALLALDLARRLPRRSGAKLLGAAVAVSVIPAAVYLLSDQVGILTRYGFASPQDLAAGAVLVFWMFVFTWVYFGAPFAIIGIVFFGYAFLGSHLPAPLTAPAVDVMRVTSKLTIGALGDVVELSVSVIFLILLFGSMLQASGAGAFIWHIAGAVARRMGGGTAAVTVCSSGLVATFTGVGAATVGITGPIAIPIMMRDGYTAEEAAAIEAIASTGGQITPPVLGLAAFLMADFLGVPYATIMIAAIFPALLYYFGLLAYVTLVYRSRTGARETKVGLEALQDAKPRLHLLRAGTSFVAPIALMVVLIIGGLSLQLATFWSIVGIVVLGLALRLERNVAVWLRNIADAAVMGASIGMAAGVLDVVMASLDITQLGMLVGFIVSDLGGGSRLATFLIVIAATYVMGMGMPGIAVYTVLAVTLVPVLTSLGTTPMTAHFLVMYMIILSNFTPPVAPTLVITAKIAGANYMRAGWEAMKAGATAIFLPFFLFVFPDLLLQNASFAGVVEALGVTLLSIFLLTVAFTGWFARPLSPVERLLIAAAPILAWVARYASVNSLYVTLVAGSCAVMLWLALIGRRTGQTSALVRS